MELTEGGFVFNYIRDQPATAEEILEELLE